MIFNQKKLEEAEARLKQIDANTNPIEYRLWWGIGTDQEFAKQVFLEDHIVDTWEGTPCVFREQVP